MVAGTAAFLGRLAVIGRRPWVAITALAIVCAYSIVLAGVYRGFLGSASGGGPALLPLLAVVAMIPVLTSVPITVSGLGLREQLHVVLLAELGVGREEAVGISLLLFGHVLLLSAVGAVLWVRRDRAA
jgi:glycosyltransferase 2 family protein